MNAPNWRRSSRSNTATNCVELRNDLAAIRDSKDAGGPALAFSGPGAVRRFVTATNTSR
ncbi:hypothetical protein F4560_000167 [Saccharothrix ecbatanensis]|uniref:DUF397 domain-containing protein n=1 Tax=Saccharothrix ecbatanensis TaxID=1105145 RepID=A0A7W9LY37_9PSEU|nr:DUF397 domain-containing protein [Saccharothrix ecbatanensis]MBB5800399.1 hypothetical protein [Saccharothrix ecbatanensis]